MALYSWRHCLGSSVRSLGKPLCNFMCEEMCGHICREGGSLFLQPGEVQGDIKVKVFDERLGLGLFTMRTYRSMLTR